MQEQLEAFTVDTGYFLLTDLLLKKIAVIAPMNMKNKSGSILIKKVYHA